MISNRDLSVEAVRSGEAQARPMHRDDRSRLGIRWRRPRSGSSAGRISRTRHRDGTGLQDAWICTRPWRRIKRIWSGASPRLVGAANMSRRRVVPAIGGEW